MPAWPQGCNGGTLPLFCIGRTRSRFSVFGWCEPGSIDQDLPPFVVLKICEYL
jgi:hypothetical protein